MPKVYNVQHNNSPKTAVYVGRPTAFGNPYPVRNDDRKRAVALYRAYLMGNRALLTKVKKELKGKDLLCFCAPLPCHADVLLEVANDSQTNGGNGLAHVVNQILT